MSLLSTGAPIRQPLHISACSHLASIQTSQVMTEEELIAKLEKVERLFAGATSDGERLAASLAQKRLTERLQEFAKTEQAEEWKFSMNDEWSRKLFTALLRRYGITPYRYKRQRYTTVMARVPASFVNEILWPEYSELNNVLTSYLASVTDRVINNHIHKNSGDAEVVAEPKSLGGV